MPNLSTLRAIPRQGGYLSKTCLERVTKDNMPLTYPPEMALPPSAFLQGLFDGGNAFEAHIGQLLAEQMPASELAMIVEEQDEDGKRTREGKRAKEEATFAAYLNPNVRLLFNPRLGPVFEQLLGDHLGVSISDEVRISEPDLIELGDILPNGLRAMRFIDIKWHHITSGTSKNPKSLHYSRLDAPYLDSRLGCRGFYGTIHGEDWRQLAHYYRHAQTLGLVAAEKDGGAWAGVIGAEEIVVWADLDTLQLSLNRKRMSALAIYDATFTAALDVVGTAIARDADPTVPAVTFPQWSTDCGECPWKDVCKAELVAHGRGGHITLLPGVTPTRAAPLYKLGITDVATLAERDPLTSDVPEAHVYTARVALAGHAYLNADRNELDLPRADIEVDFDCESDEYVYMWGVRVTDTTTGVVTEHTFDDYTVTPEGERDQFVAVWDYFTALTLSATAAGKTIRFYHYTAYERTQMRKLAETYHGDAGVPDVDAVEDWFDYSGAVVDLYRVVSGQVVWPTPSQSIKKVAVFTGFSWRDETPGGDNSMLWYRAGCSDSDEAVRQANITRLREYNLDDVHAQAHIRTWLSSTPLQSVTVLGPDGR